MLNVGFKIWITLFGVSYTFAIVLIQFGGYEAQGKLKILYEICVCVSWACLLVGMVVMMIIFFKMVWNL